MNKREAKRIADEDTTPYGVYIASPRTLFRVTGYRNAVIIRNHVLPGEQAVILTQSEMENL